MIKEIAEEVIDLVERLDWEILSKYEATTGSIYIKIKRKNEYLVIRVADHKQIHHRWFTTYSLAPGDMFYEQIELILKKPYGEAGDVIEP